MSTKKTCQKVILVLIIINFLIPFTFCSDNQVYGDDSFQLDAAALNEIDISRIYNFTEHLTTYQTRETGTLECNLAANDIYTELNETYNVTDLFYETYMYNGTSCFNLVARINGTNLQDEIILITAHYDSISISEDAPGANDNAVAVAVCMELMGVIQNNFSLNRTLLYIAFSGEEQAFIGSQHWVNQHKSDLPKIVAVLNLDMIGVGNHLSIIKNDQSDWLADAIMSASSPVDVTFTKSNSPYPESARFDHDTFWTVNVPCVTLFEGGSIYLYYHTSEDTIDKISFSLVEKCAQATLMSVLFLGTVNFQHNWLVVSIVIWSSWGLAAILPFVLYKKVK